MRAGTEPAEAPERAEQLLDALDSLGVHHRVCAETDAPQLTWLSFGDLLEDVAEHVDTLGTAFGHPRRAVTASILARSLLALVVSPVAISWSRWRRTPDLGAENLRLGMDQGRVVTVAMGEPRLVRTSGDDTSWFGVAILDGVCDRAIGALRTTAPLGTRHLWGNVALAIASPFAGLLATGRHDGRRDRDLLLRARSGLSPLVEVVPVPDDRRPIEVVRRRTCCLLTKLPEPHGAMCGTCSLHPREAHIDRLASYYRGLGAEAEGSPPRG